MKSLLLSCIALDPLAMHPNASHEPLWTNVRLSLSTAEIDGTSKFMRFRRATEFIKCLVRHTLRFTSLRFWKWPRASAGGIACIACTRNQRVALEPVIETLTKLGIKASLNEYRLNEDTSLLQLLPGAYWLSLPFLPILMARMLTASGYRRKSFAWGFHEYWLSYGLYAMYSRWLSRVRPAAIIVANDHILQTCTLVEAARRQSIPTFYLQHACVTCRFPPLRTNYALLDGIDAAEKYAAAGSSDTKVYLVGVPRFDAFANHVNTSRVAKRIGVAVSRADDLNLAEKLIRDLTTKLPEQQLEFRLHPGMDGSHGEQFRKLCGDLGCAYSGLIESSFDFLNRIDVLIAGTSSILSEAALMNVTPVTFPLNAEIEDWYQFVENGLCDSYSDIEELCSYLRAIAPNRPVVRQRAARYCATVDTENEGHSAELAARTIVEVVYGL